MMRRVTRAAGLAVVLLCPMALGQPPQGMPEQEWRFSAEGRTGYLVGGDGDGEGTLDALITEATLAAEGPLWRGAVARLAFDWQVRRYDPRDDFAPYADPEFPIRDMHAVGVSGSLLQILGPKWGVIVRGGVVGSAEVGADLDDGVSWNVVAGAGYRFSSDFRGGLGVLILGRLEDDLLVVPAPQFDWRISETWRLSLEGPELELTWQPEEDWLFGFGARYDSFRARLADEAPTDHGIFEDLRVPLTARVRHQLAPSTAVELSLGVDVWRRVRTEDRSGDKLTSTEFDPGFFAGLALELTF